MADRILLPLADDDSRRTRVTLATAMLRFQRWGNPVRKTLRCHDCGTPYESDVDALNALEDHTAHNLLLAIEQMRPSDDLPREFRILDLIATRGEAMISDLESLTGVLLRRSSSTAKANTDSLLRVPSWLAFKADRVLKVTVGTGLPTVRRKYCAEKPASSDTGTSGW